MRSRIATIAHPWRGFGNTAITALMICTLGTAAYVLHLEDRLLQVQQLQQRQQQEQVR
mgnify:CR=1 FL=1